MVALRRAGSDLVLCTTVLFGRLDRVLFVSPATSGGQTCKEQDLTPTRVAERPVIGRTSDARDTSAMRPASTAVSLAWGGVERRLQASLIGRIIGRSPLARRLRTATTIDVADGRKGLSVAEGLRDGSSRSPLIQPYSARRSPMAQRNDAVRKNSWPSETATVLRQYGEQSSASLFDARISNLGPAR